MAIRTMHRLLNLSTGHISLYDWEMDGYVSLDTIEVEYDDQMKPEHAQLIADAIDKRVTKLNADIAMMQQKKKDLLVLAYSAPVDADWEEVDEPTGRG